jgi:hypothetical protein
LALVEMEALELAPREECPVVQPMVHPAKIHHLDHSLHPVVEVEKDAASICLDVLGMVAQLDPAQPLLPEEKAEQVDPPAVEVVVQKLQEEIEQVQPSAASEVPAFQSTLKIQEQLSMVPVEMHPIFQEIKTVLQPHQISETAAQVLLHYHQMALMVVKEGPALSLLSLLYGDGHKLSLQIPISKQRQIIHALFSNIVNRINNVVKTIVFKCCLNHSLVVSLQSCQ